MTKIPTYFLQAFAELSESFPNWKPTERTIEVWYEMLKDVKPDDLARAVVRTANEEAWPTIHAIRTRATPNDRPSAEEAWTEVFARVKRTGDREIMDRSGLPENAIAALAAIGGRLAIRNVTSDGIGTLRAHFMRIYEAHENRATESEKRDLAYELRGARDDAHTLKEFNERDKRDMDDEERASFDDE